MQDRFGSTHDVSTSDSSFFHAFVTSGSVKSREDSDFFFCGFVVAMASSLLKVLCCFNNDELLRYLAYKSPRVVYAALCLW